MKDRVFYDYASGRKLACSLYYLQIERQNGQVMNATKYKPMGQHSLRASSRTRVLFFFFGGWGRESSESFMNTCNRTSSCNCLDHITTCSKNDIVITKINLHQSPFSADFFNEDIQISETSLQASLQALVPFPLNPLPPPKKKKKNSLKFHQNSNFDFLTSCHEIKFDEL